MNCLVRIFLSFVCALSTPLLAGTPYLTQTWKTSTGVQVILYQTMDLPMLDIKLAFGAGSAYDGEKPGVSALTAAMIDEGNAGLGENLIAENLDSVGAQFSAESSRDMTVLSLRTLTSEQALPEALSTFEKIIGHPDFPPKSFEQEKKQQLQMIAIKEESPEAVANREFFKALYGDHPYGHPTQGSSASVSAIDLSDIRAFYTKYYVGSNAVMVLVGAIDSSLAKKIAEQLTHALAVGKRAPAIPKAPALKKASTITIPFPSSQTVLRLGQVGMDYLSPDFFPILVGNYILGGGVLVSRLEVEVREKQGLTYGINSQFTRLMGKGPFVISFSTKNKEALRALNLSKDILTSFVQKGVQASEVEAAKKYLIGAFPRALSSNRAIADVLLKIVFYQLPEDYLATYVSRVEAVKIEDIQKAFSTLLNLETLVTVMVGQA